MRPEDVERFKRYGAALLGKEAQVNEGAISQLGAMHQQLTESQAAQNEAKAEKSKADAARDEAGAARDEAKAARDEADMSRGQLEVTSSCCTTLNPSLGTHEPELLSLRDGALLMSELTSFRYAIARTGRAKGNQAEDRGG